MKIRLLIVLLLSILAIPFSMVASDKQVNHAVAVDLLVGSDDITGLRVAYRPHIYSLENVPYFDELDIYWEVSINFWEFGKLNQHETNYVVAFSPVIGKTFYHIDNKYPLRWEFGIGISLVEDTRFAGKNIGSHYQFEDITNASIYAHKAYKAAELLSDLDLKQNINDLVVSIDASK